MHKISALLLNYEQISISCFNTGARNKRKKLYATVQHKLFVCINYSALLLNNEQNSIFCFSTGAEENAHIKSIRYGIS